MTSGNDKWIRSVKDNAAGKVVADPEGNRWEWQDGDDATSHLLKRLHNDELAIEQTDIVPVVPAGRDTRQSSPEPAGASRNDAQRPKRAGRDAGGGFNPYDNSGKARRR
jgi:hypothetical protein